MQQKTPTEQAIIQFIESIVITAIIAGLVSISTIVTGSGPINIQQTALNFGLAFVFSLAHSLAAYLKALPAPEQGQPDYSALGTILDGFLSALQQRLEAVKPVQVVQVQPQAVPATTQPQNVTPKAQPVAQPAAVPVTPAVIDWSTTNPATPAVKAQ